MKVRLSLKHPSKRPFAPDVDVTVGLHIIGELQMVLGMMYKVTNIVYNAALLFLVDSGTQALYRSIQDVHQCGKLLGKGAFKTTQHQ